MKILITGGAGFIGSHLYQSLKSKGLEVLAIDNFSHACGHSLNKQVIYKDIRYYNDIAPLIEWCDILVHLGAEINVDKSIKHPEETIDTNVKGTLNCLEAVRKYGKKMIFASTSEIYGTSKCQFMDESHPTLPQSPYGASKLAGDALCRAYYETYKTNVMILRNFNIFGPYQNSGEGAGSSYGSVISIFANKALNNEDIIIFGDGEQSRDYMYIDDTVGAYELCINKIDSLVGQCLNMGTGKTITINELAKKIIKITNSVSEIKHIEPRAGEVKRLCCDNRKAQGLGLVPATNFDLDLQKYITWCLTK